MPKNAEIEYTPNPNAVKFVLKEPVAIGVTRSYDSAEKASGDPLARDLFAVRHVLSVFYQDRFLTVTKDGEIGWPDLLPKLAAPIRSAPSAASLPPEARSKRQIGETPSAEWTPEMDRIQGILDETILPALAADGGGLELVNLKDHVLHVRYHGACGTCPSSLTGTLSAIEGLLQKEVDPELSVVAI